MTSAPPLDLSGEKAIGLVPAAPARTEIVAEPSTSPRGDGAAELRPLRIGGNAFAMHLCSILFDEKAEPYLGDQVVETVLREHEVSLQQLVQGRLEMAICTLPLRHRDRRRGLVEHPLGEMAIAAVVPKNSSIWNLRRDQLAEILAGTFRSWDELGGRPLGIECLTLEDDDPIWMSACRQLFPGKRSAASVLRQPNEDVMQVVLQRKPGGIALLPLFALRSDLALRALTVNGVFPSPHMVRSQKYPLRVPVRLVVARGSSEHVLRAVSYLTGQDGQRRAGELLVPAR